MIKSSLRLPLLGLAALVITLLAATFGSWRGLFDTRRTTEPVFISRSGGAGGEAQVAPARAATITGPLVVTATATSYNAAACPTLAGRRPDKPTLPEMENENEELFKMMPFEDAAQQPAAASGLAAQAGPDMPAPVRNFDGLNYNAHGSGFPPDTNGDVGLNHYIQTVNTAVGIYTKTGIELCAFDFDSLFGAAVAPTGTPCDANNNGDPVVLYDAQADRWILTDFAWTNNDDGPYYECIAASKTGDPVAGGWWLYALRADDPAHNWLNDYPKLGVWPDGIYMAANMYDCSNNCGAGTAYQGSRAWALNRTDLYSGATLRAVVFDVDDDAFTLLPSNFRGAAPPAGRPNFFAANDLNTGNPKLNIFKFHVDFAVPANSTFTGPTQVTVASFASPPNTIPVQSGNNLDSLGTRLMMQNQYQNLGGVESLWLAHTAGTNPTNIAGLRWYQLNVSGATVNTTPVQQSTFRPDAKHRWIPSLAVDRDGNMAIGYSVANGSQFADIKYTGRLASDPLNTLSNAEGLLIAGGGAQTHNCGGPCERWGDYSAMNVDPSDGCTFWYTTEYYAATGGFSDDWHTRIGSFKFPGCGVAFNHFLYLPAVIRIAPNGAWQTLTQEGFEGIFPGAGWTLSDPGFDQYFWGARDCEALTGSRSGWAMGGGSIGAGLPCGSNYINFANSWMVYGPFSLADATAAEFSINLLSKTTGADRVCWAASNDGGAQYFGNCLTGSDSGGVFVPHTLDLSNVFTLGNLVGQSNLYVAITFQSNGSDNLPKGALVDDVVLRKCVGGPCPVLQGPAATDDAGVTQAQLSAADIPQR